MLTVLFWGVATLILLIAAGTIWLWLLACLVKLVGGG